MLKTRIAVLAAAVSFTAVAACFAANPHMGTWKLNEAKPTLSVWVGKFDGKAYPVKGNLPYNFVAYRVVNDRTNDITAMKDGKVGWNGRITVSADGKSRTVTINGTGADGKKFSGKAVYDKA